MVLTFPNKSDRITPCTARKRRSTRHERCTESPWFGEKGRAADGEYTLELAPQRPLGPVGVLRERPLPRRRVLARPEAAFAREAANQRWYRERPFALCPRPGRRAFCHPLLAGGSVQYEQRRDQRCRSTKNSRPAGLIAQVTDEEEIRELVNNGKATFYIGFDPTADSLHVGHFMALCLMKRLQMAGNRPIALIGGGTGYDRRPLRPYAICAPMMTPETIQHNCDCFKKQMERFIEFGEGKAMMLNNADWLLKLNYVELLREVGACFSVNNMLRAECYKQRMEKGLSFLEFNYMIMQSYDFYHMFQTVGCNMQFGGDDQWSNMLGGTELIRRKLGKDAYAMTITLLLNSEGKKMGKTASGAVWLDPNKTISLRFLPVLAERGRRGRAQVHPDADLPASGADRRDGPVGGQPAEHRQGDPGL